MSASLTHETIGQGEDVLASGTTSTAGDRKQRTKNAVLFAALGVALLAGIVVSAGSGQLHIPAAEVVGSILHKLGLGIGPMPQHPQGDNTLWQVRFPRVALALIVGASLAAAGALMQGVFGNPLAEPSIVGVSAGAACAAAIAIVFQLTYFGAWTVAAFAFFGGLLATGLVYGFARQANRTDVGLVVPHLVRMLTGPGHRVLIPASALGGAFLLLIADLLARNVIA